MVLDARLYEKKKTMQASAPLPPTLPKTPQSNKNGDLEKCPSLDAKIEQELTDFTGVYFFTSRFLLAPYRVLSL